MTRSRWVLVGVVVIAVVAIFFTKGPPAPTPDRPGAVFSFAALGDAPYILSEEWQFPQVVKDIAQNDVAFVVHVGDIFWRPCTDEMYRQALARFDAMRHPVIYTPGDNEWTDCWEKGSGGYRPQERLQRIRQIFYAKAPLPLVRQTGFIENARWEHDGVLFATVDIPGSGNGFTNFEGRTAQDDAANHRRTEAAAAWVREAFATAIAHDAKAVVIAFQANMDLEDPPRGYQQKFEPFFTTLIEESRRFRKPVLALHGDGHIYTIDRPAPRAPNMTRLQVPGSPRVGWVRIFVTPGARMPWAFEAHVVPTWKYW